MKRGKANKKEKHKNRTALNKKKYILLSTDIILLFYKTNKKISKFYCNKIASYHVKEKIIEKESFGPFYDICLHV